MKEKSEIQFEVRTMRKGDFPQVMDMQRETGWQWTVQGDYLWYEVDPDGWKVAVTDSGEVLGMCCAVRHHDDLHFVGFYLVKNGYRGKGIGSQLWKSCLEYIGDRNAGLNAVPEMIDKYKTHSGFSFVHDDCLLHEYETDNEVHPEHLSCNIPEGVSVLPYEESHLEAIFKYDRTLSGYNRQKAIELNCKDADGRTLVAFKDGACVGYATMRIGVLDIPHLGPMYADKSSTAEYMLKELLIRFSSKKGFSMITFGSNMAANELMGKIGCSKVGVLPRMYIKDNLSIDFSQSIHKMYAVFDVYFTPF